MAEIAPTEGARSIDLSVSGVAAAPIIDVRQASSCSISLTDVALSTAVVEVVWSNDKATWQSLPYPRVATGTDTNFQPFDVISIPWLALNVTTTGSGSPNVSAWIDRYDGTLAPDAVGFDPVAVDAADTTNGRLVAITGTTTGTADTLHTASAAASLGDWDEITLHATNIDATTDIDLTVEWGGTGAADQIIITLPPKCGLVPVVTRRRLRGGLVVSAFADSANVVNVHVQAERIREGAA